RDRAVRRQHDDRQPGMALVHALEQLHSVEAVHPEVRDDRVRPEAGEAPERTLRARGGLDVVARTAELDGEQPQELLVVVDDEYLWMHFRLCGRHVRPPTP